MADDPDPWADDPDPWDPGVDPWVDTWTAQECAEFWGLTNFRSWHDKVAKGYAPRPLPGFDEQRHRRWYIADVKAAKANRVGQGARTDLTRKAEET